MDLYPVRQPVPFICSVTRLVLVDYHSDTCRYQEVLLSQTELFAYSVCVIRIEYACDSLYLAAFLHRLAVVAGVESFHVDGIVYRLRVPEVERVDRLSAESDDRHIIRHRSDGGVVDVLVFHHSILERSLDLAAESYHYRVVRLCMLPYITFIKPCVRDLYLVAALYPLFEESELVPKAHAVALDAERSHRVEETGRQSSEAAVSEARIRLRIQHLLKVLSIISKSFFCLIEDAEIEEIVLHQLSDKEFHREVINSLVLFLLFLS